MRLNRNSNVVPLRTPIVTNASAFPSAARDAVIVLPSKTNQKTRLLRLGARPSSRILPGPVNFSAKFQSCVARRDAVKSDGEGGISLSSADKLSFWGHFIAH